MQKIPKLLIRLSALFKYCKNENPFYVTFTKWKTTNISEKSNQKIFPPS